jgi:hypothetical protein
MRAAMTRCFWTGLLIGCILLAAVEADAAEAPDATQSEGAHPWTRSDGWRFELVPYLWATGISGDVGVLTLPPEHFGASFSEVLKHLDLALMGAARVRKGDWSLLVDVTWAKLTQSNSTPKELGYSGVDLTVAETIFNADIGYRLPGPERLDWGVYAGIRWFNVDATLDFQAGVLPASSASETRGWVDPVIGLAATYWFCDHWFATALADAGGFGVGSHFTSQLFGVAGSRWTPWFATTLGYRALFVNYSSTGFTFDVWDQGVFLGFAFSL